MSDITITKHIEASPDEVFRVASDFAAAAEHIEGIVKIEMLTDGPVGVGTRFRETRILFKREATEELEVTAFEPPRSYSIGCENHGCRFRTEMRFTPNGTGTDVEMVFGATPLSLVARAMAAMMQPMIQKMEQVCHKDLDDLKAVIESR